MLIEKRHKWALRGIAGILFLFAGLAAVGSLFLWGQGFLLDPPIGVDLSYPVADILVNAPASIIAAVGLWRGRRYGYIAAHFAAGLYTYASAEIFADVLQGDLPASAEILAPQLLALVVAAVLVFYVGRMPEAFRRRSA